jgi:hypothetical protein
MATKADAQTHKLRWNDVFKDVTSAGAEDESREWPNQDYFAAAVRCKNDLESLEKLHRICEDLEGRISLVSGPGSFARLSGVPVHALKHLEGKCWREVLTDASHLRLVWIGIANFGEALQGKGMDSGSARFGKIVAMVATRRLQKIGEPMKSESSRRNEIESERLLQKPYVPEFISSILRNPDSSRK